MKKRRMSFRRIILILLCVIMLGFSAVAGINAAVKWTAGDQILTAEEAAKLSDVDCILVLGCKVHSDGDPSDMLEDRLQRGVELFDLGAAPKLLMSGDHGQTDYDEVDAMKQFAVNHGISSEDVFMDHAGFPPMKVFFGQKRSFRRTRSLS